MTLFTDAERARFRWACRRGMLELDLFLQPFFEAKFEHLSAADQQAFVALLACSDPELFAWLMGHETPSKENLRTLCEMIRNYAQLST
jgi:antitoxin CptB